MRGEIKIDKRTCISNRLVRLNMSLLATSLDVVGAILNTADLAAIALDIVG